MKKTSLSQKEKGRREGKLPGLKMAYGFRYSPSQRPSVCPAIVSLYSADSSDS